MVTPVDLHALRRFAPLGDEPLAALAALTSRRECAPQAWLLEGGRQAEWCFLLSAGLVREYYLGAGGEEHTRAFIGEGQLISRKHLASYLGVTPEHLSRLRRRAEGEEYRRVERDE